MSEVLVVDDSSTMRRIHQKSLEKMGYAVCVAKDGVDALLLLSEKRQMDLILTDVHMPNMDGIALTQQIRKMEKFQQSKILVVTSDGTLDVVEAAINAGANDVLIKPFTPADFVERVKAVLDA